MTTFKDEGDELLNEQGDGIEGRDTDPDAMAFIKAKRNVDDLHKAKRQEKKGGMH